MVYEEAVNQLPEGSRWSSSFGNPGGYYGYTEFHRSPDGRVFRVESKECSGWNGRTIVRNDYAVTEVHG